MSKSKWAFRRQCRLNFLVEAMRRQSRRKVRAADESEWAREKGEGNGTLPDVLMTSFSSWDELGKWFGGVVALQVQVTPPIQAKAEELTRGKINDREKIQALYEFVFQHFRDIGVSLGQGRYTPHRAEDVLANRYGEPGSGMGHAGMGEISSGGLRSGDEVFGVGVVRDAGTSDCRSPRDRLMKRQGRSGRRHNRTRWL
jgi:hypothetical protein